MAGALGIDYLAVLPWDCCEVVNLYHLSIEENAAVLVQSTGQAGIITINASSGDLSAGSYQLIAVSTNGSEAEQ